MKVFISISYLIVGLSQVSPSHRLLPKSVAKQNHFSIASQSTGVSWESLEVLPPPLGELITERCQEVPTGIGIPAFQPGITKEDVLRILGTPTGTAPGYWPNTRAVFYDLIPEHVSLGFLFDRHSQRIRQTEASFTPGVDDEVVVLTLNGMLGCQLNSQIQDGLQQVWQQEQERYYFQLGSLQGVIERQKSGRLYIGIWEADLH